MSEPLYRSLVWLEVRLGVLCAVGVPRVLLVWAALRRQGALLRLLGLYWKVASLLLIALLLHTGDQPVAYGLVVIALVLITLSLWFWVDLNEELADLPPWRPLPLTVRIWRWALTIFALGSAVLASTAVGCMAGALRTSSSCLVWRQAPLQVNAAVDGVFDFVLGGDWTPLIAAIVGYLALFAYGVGFVQWLMLRLPKQGRVAGEF